LGHAGPTSRDRRVPETGERFGWVAGAMTSALGGISPFVASGTRDAAGVGRLIVAGLVGLSAIATFLPDKLNETYRKRMTRLEHAGGG